MGQTRSGALLTDCWADTEFPEVMEKCPWNQLLSPVAETHTERGPRKGAGGLQELLMGGLLSTARLTPYFCRGEMA